MKHYIGVKHIQAEPMEKDGKAGYKVVYPDGYESWSPKDVFEEAYTPFATQEVSNFVLNMVKETLDMSSHILYMSRQTGNTKILQEMIDINPELFFFKLLTPIKDTEE